MTKTQFEYICIAIKEFKEKRSALILNDLRYEVESQALSLLASLQLNSEKNINKPPIENMRFHQITDLIKSELRELEEEIYEKNSFCKKENINKQRVYEEVGDVAAYLAGIIAKIEKEIS